MRRGRLLIGALLVVLGCRRAPDVLDGSATFASAAASIPPPLPAATASAPPATRPVRKAMTSYVTAYASPARASRVRTAVHPLTSLSRVTALKQRPVSVVVNPAVDHVGVTYATGFDVWTPKGSPTYRTDQSSDVVLTMLDHSFLENGSAHEWNGQSIPMALRERDLQWALEVGDEWTSAVLMSKPRLVPVRVPLDGGVARSWKPVDAHMLLASERFFLPERFSADLVWSEYLEGAGCGAIADDRRIAVAMRQGRFLVFDGNRATPDQKGVKLVDAPLGFAAYDLAIVESGYALLSVGSPMPADAPALTPLGSALAIAARRVELSPTPAPRWRTVVHHLDPRGHEIAQAEIPFEVLQPPIDAGAGRVFALGNGVAAFDGGRLLYAQPSPLPMLGTAFEDGSLALAIGPELRILTRDGAVQQTFTTAEREAITTPPAIGSDGSVWVGTEKALYVAR
ncbi:hypothetical protein BE15_30660 [Sorangium cellulosum]|uniref:Uncharacterized protein n=1 Tax=Sorangium cellulosum TaxID=56 RepID=A0A150QSE7_SORCE|nr:hypothetical protein BE15_30660 [Sorangium cellulosum]